jgi:predicted N-acetyltransferase YhbS
VRPRLPLGRMIMMAEKEDAMQMWSNIFRFMSDYHYYRRVGYQHGAAWRLATKTLPMR